MLRIAPVTRSILALLVGAIATGLVACGDTASTVTPSATAVDPAGVWTFVIVVTKATGDCAGEEGQTSSDPITITKTGSAPPYQVTATGFLGISSNTLTGTFANNKLVISGSYPEDGGTTTTTHTLVATDDNHMVGDEDWSWMEPGGGTCPGSAATTNATRN